MYIHALTYFEICMDICTKISSLNRLEVFVFCMNLPKGIINLRKNMRLVMNLCINKTRVENNSARDSV